MASTAQAFSAGDDQVRGVVLVFHDVGQQRKLARQLSFQASHDPLTGLFNRREFEAQLRRLLESAQVQRQQHAVCYIDLDQFKVVNDVCGHVADEMDAAMVVPSTKSRT